MMPDPRGALIIGAFITSMVWALLAVGTLLGGWLHEYLGQMGEEFTDTELKRLKKQGLVVEHSLSKGTRDGTDTGHHRRREFDIDHVAISPTRVLVIDTKWRTDPSELHDYGETDLARYASRLRQDAHRIQRVLAAAGVTHAEPLIFVWGPSTRLPDGYSGTEVEGVPVMIPQLDPEWSQRLPVRDGQHIDVAYARQLLRDHFSAFSSGKKMSPKIVRARVSASG
jgi:hypothetical protein